MRALLLLLLVGCTPDIVSGAYFCGEEMSCPEGLRCDGVTAECVYPRQAEPFVCPAGSNEREPDDALEAPADVGVTGCGDLGVMEIGCIDAAADVDHLLFTTPAGCTTPLRLRLLHPVGFAELELDLLDPDGTLVAAGEDCGLDTNGQRTGCLDAEVEPDTEYVIRIRIAEDAPVCDGLCAFNRYQLSIL